MTLLQPGFDRHLDDASRKLDFPIMRDRLVVRITGGRLIPAKHVNVDAKAQVMCMGHDFEVTVHNFTRKNLCLTTLGTTWKMSTKTRSSLSSSIDPLVKNLVDYRVERSSFAVLVGPEKPDWIKELDTPDDLRGPERLQRSDLPFVNIRIPIQYGVVPEERDTYFIGQSFNLDLKVFL
jgi:hypothetical protein